MLSFVGAFTKLRKQLLALSCPSVSPHGTTGLTLDGFSRNLLREYFSKNLPRKLNFNENLSRVTGTLHEDHYTFLTICR